MLFATAGMWIFFFPAREAGLRELLLLVAFTLLLAVAASPGATEDSTSRRPDESSHAR